MQLQFVKPEEQFQLINLFPKQYCHMQVLLYFLVLASEQIKRNIKHGYCKLIFFNQACYVISHVYCIFNSHFLGVETAESISMLWNTLLIEKRQLVGLN
jgi:hypothetical protein